MVVGGMVGAAGSLRSGGGEWDGVGMETVLGFLGGGREKGVMLLGGIGGSALVI